MGHSKAKSVVLIRMLGRVSKFKGKSVLHSERASYLFGFPLNESILYKYIKSSRPYETKFFIGHYMQFDGADYEILVKFLKDTCKTPKF